MYDFSVTTIGLSNFSRSTLKCFVGALVRDTIGRPFRSLGGTIFT